MNDSGDNTAAVLLIAIGVYVVAMVLVAVLR